MGLFSGDVTNVNNYVGTTEIRIMAGATVVVALLLTIYLLMRMFNKYNKKTIQAHTSRAVALNNISCQK